MEKKLTLESIPSFEVSDDLLWEGTFEEYLNKCVEHPPTVRTAHQRLHDALTSFGSTSYTHLREKVVRYNVFDDPFTPEHRYAIYGKNVDVAFMHLMKVIRAAAQRLGQEHRIILLRGPVGTAKSTFSELAMLSLQHYTRLPEGQLFSLLWEVEDGDEEGKEILGTITRKFQSTRLECPLHEEPLRALSIEIRKSVVEAMNSRVNTEVQDMFFVEGNPCPLCNSIFWKLMRRYKNNWKQVVEKHVRVKRYTLDKSLRQGIVTARPKSEKDQDVSEFLGSTNFTNLGAFGSSTDPRTFDFRGHYMAGNRGGLFFEEWLKFSTAFLYDCLGASQEHRVQPKGFMEVDVDLFILGTTNEPEYRKLVEQKEMEALRDRTIVVDIPYILGHRDEIRIYRKFFGPSRTGGKHLAPRTRYLAAYWAILSRLKDPEKGNLDLRKKLKLYDDRTVEGYTEDMVRELMNDAEREGLDGISPRIIQNKVSNVLMTEDDTACVDFFHLLEELEHTISKLEGINDEQKERLKQCLVWTQEEMKELIAEDVQEAATHGDEDLKELYSRYIDQVVAHVNKEKVTNTTTRQRVDPDEAFMRSIEDKIGITDHDDFRSKIMNLMAARAIQSAKDPSIKPFDFRSDERLYRALRLYLFSQLREKINWEVLISNTPLRSEDGKTEGVRLVQQIKDRLIHGAFGSEQESYCAQCATKVLSFYASEFAREKTKN